MEKLRTLDLFSGIGGFTLGLDSTGYFETVAFCEIEAFPCKVLNKHWPEVPIYNDVKELSYEKLQADGIISRRRGIDVICGGYPCQPFSVAGRQGGEHDPRHLWPEYFRLVRELRPHYAIGENVGGHLRLGLDTVLEDLDSENYTVRCFSVEASSLGAPHRRERIFWIADNMADRHPGFGELTDEEIQTGRYALNGSGATPMADSVSDEHRFEIGESSGVSESLSRKHRQENSASGEPIGTGAIRRTDNGHETDVPDTQSERRGGRNRGGRGAEQRELLKTEQEGRALGREAERCSELSGTEYVPDTHSEGLEGAEKARNSEEERTLAEQFTARQGAKRSEEERRKTTFESYLGGGNDGISAWLDGSWERGIPRVAPSNKLRVPRLKALGNAVLPQLVYMVGMAIVLSTKSSENEEESGG